MDKSHRQRALKVQLPNCSGFKEINFAQTAPSLIVLSRANHVTLLFSCSVSPPPLPSSLARRLAMCVHARLLPTHPYGSASNEAFTRAVGRNFLNIAEKKTIRLSRLIKPTSFFSPIPLAGIYFCSAFLVNEVLCLFFLFFPPPLEEGA